MLDVHGVTGSSPVPRTIKETSFVYHRQKRFFLAFWAKNGQNTVKSGFGAGDQLLQSPFFCVQAAETAENAGVLFAFLCSAKKEQKCLGGGSRTKYPAKIYIQVMI